MNAMKPLLAVPGGWSATANMPHKFPAVQCAVNAADDRGVVVMYEPPNTYGLVVVAMLVATVDVVEVHAEIMRGRRTLGRSPANQHYRVRSRFQTLPRWRRRSDRLPLPHSPR